MKTKLHLMAGAIVLAVAQSAGAQQATQQKDAQQSSNPPTAGMTSNAKSATPAGEQGKTPQLMTASVDHSRAMEGLLQAAQQLRESIQALARQPAGPKRSAAIEAARHALVDTHQAMLKLPPDLRVESKDRRAASDWPKAMARLDQAAESLRESVQAMSKQQSAKSSDKTADKAISAAREALEEAQQAMMALPDYSS